MTLLLIGIIVMLVFITATIVAVACCKAAKQADEDDARLLNEYLLKQNAEKPPVN